MRFSCYLVLFLCSTFSFSQDFQYSSLLINKELKDNANAVVRLDEMVVDILAQDNMIIKSKRVVTVFNKKGGKHVNAYAGYSNSTKVKFIKAVIYDALGNEIKKIKEKDFVDVSAVSGGTLYSDYRVKYIDYTPIGYPYTVVFEKEIQTKNTVTIPSWYFLDGYLVSVEKSIYTVNFPNEDLKPRIAKKNEEEYRVELDEKSNSKTYSLNNIKAIKFENHSPDFRYIFPRLQVAMTKFHYEGYNATLSNWNEMGKWMYRNLIKERLNLPESTKTTIRRMVKDAITDSEKARIVYNYVQENTRYISVQEGIGGIQPISAAEVDRVKYGDCKGLTNYTKALLDVVGVKSNYSRVYASRDKQIDVDEDFPSFLGQTNHVILNIPRENKEDIWLECTSQKIPFGFVGDFTDNRNVFVVDKDGGRIIKTSAYLEKQNLQKIEAKINLLLDGAIKASVLIETRGVQYDNRFYMEDLDRDKILEYYQDTWPNINNLVLEDYAFDNNKREVKFIEDININAKSYARPSGERMLFSPNALNKNSYVPKRYRSRKLPFQVQRGYLDVDSYIISIPEDYGIEALPEPIEIVSEFGEYKASVLEQEDGTLKYERLFLLKSGAYPKEKYGEYRNFRKKVSKNDKAQVVLIKK
ncbi:DUF3857 domain-containing protein [Maribacter sp.]|uniref:DUF3857 domain-containing protein n=1 Tax=Maribacter sp. TaxID=1897614 RepID=UPI0025BA2055|nr:DUF3857 domain-containing protein [Maribacter sp.]